MDVALRVCSSQTFSLLFLSQAACDGEIFSASAPPPLPAGIGLAIIGCCLKVGIDHLDGAFIPPSPTVSRSPYVKSPPHAPFCRFSPDLAGATFDKHGGWFAVIGAD